MRMITLLFWSTHSRVVWNCGCNTTIKQQLCYISKHSDPQKYRDICYKHPVTQNQGRQSHYRKPGNLQPNAVISKRKIKATIGNNVKKHQGLGRDATKALIRESREGLSWGREQGGDCEILLSLRRQKMLFRTTSKLRRCRNYSTVKILVNSFCFSSKQMADFNPRNILLATEQVKVDLRLFINRG